MWTFSKLWNIKLPDEAKKIIKEQSKNIHTPRNLEEQAIKLVGIDGYEKLIKGYTLKQWKKDPKELPPEIIKRLPVRYTYDNNYFNDIYQGIPIEGYTKIFEKLLQNTEYILNINYLENKSYWNNLSKYVIFTGKIDEYFNYQYGRLEYKTTNFVHTKLNVDNYQGTAMMNFTDEKIPYTRIIEHKHFEFSTSPVTWITHEYPAIYTDETEPLYPVNDVINNQLYKKYKVLSEKEQNILFGGRLGEYKYYDMHQVIESALNFVSKLIENKKIS